MSIRSYLDNAKRADAIEAARAGERSTFRSVHPYDVDEHPNGPVYTDERDERHVCVNSDGLTCANCGARSDEHVREIGLLFCPEWALRERFGR